MPSLALVGSSLSSHYFISTSVTGETQEIPHIIEHQRLKLQGAESLPLSWEKCASSWPVVFTWLHDSTKKKSKEQKQSNNSNGSTWACMEYSLKCQRKDVKSLELTHVSASTPTGAVFRALTQPSPSTTETCPMIMPIVDDEKEAQGSEVHHVRHNFPTVCR